MDRIALGQPRSFRPVGGGGGDVYATGHREGRLASLGPRMTSLLGRPDWERRPRYQNVNKAAATAAICRGSRWLVVHCSAITGGINGCICLKSHAYA